MKKFLAILLVAILLVSVTACGSSSEASSNVAENSETANNEPVEIAQGVTDTTVTVANSLPTSGAYSSIGGPFKLGMEAYFKMINDAGGIAGRQIEYIHQDDAFDPVKGEAALKEFVENEKVFAIVGHFGTPTVSATVDYLKQSGIPAVYFGTGIGALYNENSTVGTGNNLFPVQPIYNMEGRIMVSYAKGYFEAEKVGVIYTTDDAGKEFLAGIEQEAQTLGIEIVAEAINPVPLDISAQLDKMKDCDMVIAACIQATFPIVIASMEKQNLIVPVITSYVNVSAVFTATSGPFVQNLMKSDDAGIYGLGWADMSPSEDLTNFTAYMTLIGAKPEEINSYAISGWIASSFFCEGLTRVGDKPLTWENYIAAMEESPIKNPFGGYIDYVDGQRLGTQEMNLGRMDDTVDGGWIEIQPIQDMQSILIS